MLLSCHHVVVEGDKRSGARGPVPNCCVLVAALALWVCSSALLCGCSLLIKARVFQFTAMKSGGKKGKERGEKKEKGKKEKEKKKEKGKIGGEKGKRRGGKGKKRKKRRGRRRKEKYQNQSSNES